MLFLKMCYNLRNDRRTANPFAFLGTVLVAVSLGSLHLPALRAESAGDWTATGGFDAPVVSLLDSRSGWQETAPNPKCTVETESGELIIRDPQASSTAAFVLLNRPLRKSLTGFETEFSVRIALEDAGGSRGYPALTVGFQDEGGEGKSVLLGWFVFSPGDCRVALTDDSGKYLVPVAAFNWNDGKPRTYRVRKMKDGTGRMRVQVWIDGKARLVETADYEELATARRREGFRIGTSSPSKGIFRLSELFIGAPQGPLDEGGPAEPKPVPSQDITSWSVQPLPGGLQTDASETNAADPVAVDAGTVAVSSLLRVDGNRSYRLVLSGTASAGVKRLDLGVAQFTRGYPSAEPPIERVSIALPDLPEEPRSGVKDGQDRRAFEVVHEFTQREGNNRVRFSVAPPTGTLSLGAVRLEGGGKYDPSTRLSPEIALPPREEMARALEGVAPVTAKLKTFDARSRLLFDDKRVVPFWGNGPHDYPVNAGLDQWPAYRDSGLSAQMVSILPQVVGKDAFWKGKNRYDDSVVIQRIENTLRSNPQARIVIRILVDPYNAWGEENPSEVTIDQKGRKGIGRQHLEKWGGEPAPGQRFLPSLYSMKVREDIIAMIRHLVACVEQSEYGKAVVGYAICGFADAQFVNWGWKSRDGGLDDYSAPAQAAFRHWLRARYRNDVAALQSAWKAPEVTFETAAIPPAEERLSKGLWLDWQQMENVADFNRFSAEVPMDLPSAIAAEIKSLTGGNKLTVCYFASALNGWPSGAGLAHMLDQDSVDLLGAPADYWIRLPGYPGGCQSMPASVLLHQKLYMTEQDWRSFAKPSASEPADFGDGRARTQEELDAMIRRESGMMISQGQGSWILPNEPGIFPPAARTVIREASGAFQRDLVGDEPLRADVAFFVGERSLDYLTLGKGIAYRWYLLRRQRDQWDMSGVPYHLYLQSDLTASSLPDYKVYVFVSPQHLTEAERAKIEELKSNGHTLVFLHAPGVIGAADPAQAVSGITGITVEALPKPQKFMGEWLAGEGELTKDLSGPFGDRSRRGAFGDATIESFAFAVNDPGATPLAKYRDTGGIAFATRDFGTWRSIFCGIPRLESQFLNNLAREAGAWVAAPAGDAVFANQRIATIHAISSGKKQIELAAPSRVTDLTSGVVVSESSSRIEIEMKQGDTRWFWLEPVETH